MAAIEAAKGPYYNESRDAEYLALPAGVKIYEGWLVGIDPATGKAVPAGVTGVITLGRAQNQAEVDDTVRIYRGCILYEADDSLTADNKQVGKTAYAQNNNSVTTVPAPGACPAGIVMGVQNGSLWVDTRQAPCLPIPS